MTLEQLHKAIRTGRHYDDEYIWYEGNEYFVSTQMLAPLPERVFVDTVGGYKQRHGLGGQLSDLPWDGTVLFDGEQTNDTR